jgi:hypothetical protein
VRKRAETQREGRELRELRAENEEMRRRLERLEGAQANSQSGATLKNVNNGTVVHGDAIVDASTTHNHIVLNVWGGESFNHITRDRTREIVRALRTQLGGEDAKLEAVARAVTSAMAREIWVENPANRVAYLPNVKGARARVRTARGWEERSSREVEDAMHNTTVHVTGLKQPMANERDLRLMTPLLKAMDAAPVARAEMRAALIEMRPEKPLRTAPAGLAAQAGGGSKRQGPAETPEKPGAAGGVPPGA